MSFANLGWSASLMITASLFGFGFCAYFWWCEFNSEERREMRMIRRLRRRRRKMIMALRSTAPRIAYRDIQGLTR